MILKKVFARLLGNAEFRDQLRTFSSHLVLNVSLFLVVLAASMTLSTADFAHFSLANNYVILGAMLVDVGVNGAAMKLAIEKDDKHFVYANLLLKGALLLFCLILLAVSAAVGSAMSWLLIIVSCSTGLAFWYAMRGIEQFDRKFRRYTNVNLGLAASRLLFGGVAMLSENGVMILLAVHVAAILTVCIVSIPEWIRQKSVIREAVGLEITRPLFTVAPAFFLVGALYSSIPVVVQTAIYLTGDAAATGAFGIVILFTGGISLVTNTLRIYLQPQMMQKAFADVDVFGLGRGSLHSTVVTYAVILILGLLPIGFIVHSIYQQRFPQIMIILLVYGTASCIADAIGIYNMRCLRERFIWVGLKANLIRALLIGSALLVPNLDAITIVVWSAAILVFGEVLLFLLLSRSFRTWPA